MTPHRKKQIHEAFKQGVDALRFIQPHLDQGDGISGECSNYLKQKQDELDAVIASMPRYVPAARFDRMLGRYVEVDGK